MLSKELSSVKEFQRLFEVALSPVGTPLKDAPPEDVALNKRLIVEELGETVTDGIHKADAVEIADGCADSLYVLCHAINQLGRVPNIRRDDAAALLLVEAINRISLVLDGPQNFIEDGDIDRNLSYAEIVVRGVAAVYNIPLEAVFDEVHRSNMTKVWPDGKIRKDAGGKVVKPDSYEPARVAAVLEQSGSGA